MKKWETMTDLDRSVRDWRCDEGVEGCTARATWQLVDYGDPVRPGRQVIRAHRCDDHVPAKVVETKVHFYEHVLGKSPPHRHKPEECCNPLCQGQWGTGCYCCHHGKYALQVSEEEMETIVAAYVVHKS